MQIYTIHNLNYKVKGKDLSIDKSFPFMSYLFTEIVVCLKGGIIMKKITLTILLCVGIVLGITGCGNLKNESDVGEKSHIQISQNDVSLSIKDGTLNNTGATLVLTNNSDKEFQYENEYEIEVKIMENGIR